MVAGHMSEHTPYRESAVKMHAQNDVNINHENDDNFYGREKMNLF